MGIKMRIGIGRILDAKYFFTCNIRLLVHISIKIQDKTVHQTFYLEMKSIAIVFTLAESVLKAVAVGRRDHYKFHRDFG